MWKQDGDVALAEVRSHAIHDAVTAGSGLVEALDLGHRYSKCSWFRQAVAFTPR
jgi:hypothetical protein